MDEPTVRVGLAQHRQRATITLHGPYRIADQVLPAETRIEAVLSDGQITASARGETLSQGATLPFEPQAPDASFELHDMTVGIDFHWEHDEDLTFAGAASLESRGAEFDVVNEIALESYLESVISSEMAATCPPELLRAHAVASRSWLLAQLDGAKAPAAPPPGVSDIPGGKRVMRWYDREDHENFDVCADDHCQRYQGVTRQSTPEAAAAVNQTRGLVLMHAGAVCDARYGKCCGGMTEAFEAVWGDFPVAYLRAVPDAVESSWAGPLTEEAAARAFIHSAPPAFCNTTDRALLSRILPELDHDTTAFYRWEETVTADQVRQWSIDKLGLDPGRVLRLEPLERGPSGRLVRMAIEGSEQRIEVGKELEIRRVLSDSHLYSSAFTVEPTPGDEGLEFRLRGAGWGHGVGLCQIGAAVMADQGYDHEAILSHYFSGAQLHRLY